MTLNEAEVGKEYEIKELQIDGDEELQAFLFSLGCYSGEKITVVSNNGGNVILQVKDTRIALDAKMANPEKFQEMYNLEEALLKQIESLDAAGQSDQALATYGQLVEILRNTYGVDSLHV